MSSSSLFFRDLTRLSDVLKSKGDENVAYLSEIEVTCILNFDRLMSF